MSYISRDLGDILGKTVPGLGTSTEGRTNFTQTLRGRKFLTLVDGVPVPQKRTHEKPISLYPMTLHEALAKALNAPPTEQQQQKKKASEKRRQDERDEG